MNSSSPGVESQTLSVKRAEVEFHNFASLGEPARTLAAYAPDVLLEDLPGGSDGMKVNSPATESQPQTVKRSEGESHNFASLGIPGSGRAAYAPDILLGDLGGLSLETLVA